MEMGFIEKKIFISFFREFFSFFEIYLRFLRDIFMCLRVYCNKVNCKLIFNYGFLCSKLFFLK